MCAQNYQIVQKKVYFTYLHYKILFFGKLCYLVRNDVYVTLLATTLEPLVDIASG